MKTYPEWIDEYARMIHMSFSHMVPSSWHPDGFAVLRFLNGSFLKKLHAGVRELRARQIPLETVGAGFQPSSLRAAIYFSMLEYQHSLPKDKAAYKEIIEYLVSVLNTVMKEDVWAYSRNIAHSAHEISEMVTETPWKKGDPQSARELGLLYNSTSSLVYSLYHDFFPQDACDVFGPYDVSATHGEGAILLVKKFVKLRPVGVWSDLKNQKYSTIEIRQIYQNVSFKCEFVAMHTMYEGDLRQGLRAYAVKVDDTWLEDIEDVRNVRDEVTVFAQEQAKVRAQLTIQEIGYKFLDLLCYQYANLFELAGMDWRPTAEMKDSLAGKELPEKVVIESLPPYEEYVASADNEVYWLKDLYTTQ
ncbi:MAG: hypothetical protein JWM46_661 [Candidatus Kaiserbacteria bacterium]|nr:hypothetical protein [Candidatus Kaiserbacteria bacterium]